MDIRKLVQDALASYLEWEGQRIFEAAGDLPHRGSHMASDEPAAAASGIIDSTAIVIDDTVKLLPIPRQKEGE